MWFIDVLGWVLHVCNGLPDRDTNDLSFGDLQLLSQTTCRQPK